MDKPDLVVCAIVGDGEAESGPTATSGHLLSCLIYLIVSQGLALCQIH
jgi:phosphoketolase